MVKPCQWDESTPSSMRPVCKLAERVPKITRSGDIHVDQQNDLRRSAFVYIMTSLWSNPQHCLSVQSYVQTMMAPKAVVSDQEFSSISTVGKLEPSWLASWFVRAGGFSKARLEKAVQYDEDALRQLVQFSTALPTSLKLPEQCVTKKVMDDFLTWRMHEVGQRFKPLAGDLDKFLGDGGRLAWAQMGVYALSWNEDKTRAVSVQHIPSKASQDFPVHVVITPQFVLEANWSDVAAEVALGPCRYILHTFFDKDKGPNAIPVFSARTPAMKEKIAELASQHRAKLMDLQAPVAETFNAGQPKSNAESAQKARAAMNARRESVAKKRRVALSEL